MNFKIVITWSFKKSNLPSSLKLSPFDLAVDLAVERLSNYNIITLTNTLVTLNFKSNDSCVKTNWIADITNVVSSVI